MTTLKVNVIKKPTIKVKTLVKFPANVVTQNFLTVTNSGGTYTFSIDYTRLGPGPIIDPTNAFVAVLDATSGTYKEVTLASLLTSSLDADLQAIAALTGTGILSRTADGIWALRTLTAPAAGITITNPGGVAGNETFALANDLAAVEGLAANGITARTATDTWTVRTITGTANEITLTNGDGVAGNPTASLPSALTFTGKTITGGTYSGAVSYNKVVITAPATSATLTLIDGTTLTGPAASGTVMTLGNTETVTGVKTFGSAGAVGRLKVAGTTSGSTVLDATATASGTLTLPAATDTLIGKATTDILTNKTYDTAGAGNSFSINSVVANANTGTGAVVRATSPALVTPALGTPTALVLTSATGLPLSGLTTQAAFTFVGNNTSGTAVPTAVDIHALTLKASPAGTDEVIISDQAASGAWKRAPVSSLASASGVSSVNGQTGALAIILHPQGRLTLATGTPVMPSNQAAKTTIFYSAYVGNQIPIYDGTNMVPTVITGGEISVATTDTAKSPAAIGASKVNDWFVWNDAGTIRVGHGPDWTSDTARSAGTALVLVNGIWLNNASITNGPAASRGTYVGTTRSNASSQLDWINGGSGAGGVQAWLGVWNAYNRVNVQAQVIDSTSSWTYSSATVRSMNNSALNRINYICGLIEDAQLISAIWGVRTPAVAGSFYDVGWGLNTTTTRNLSKTYEALGATAAVQVNLAGVEAILPTLGFNFLQQLESGDGTNTITLIGQPTTFCLTWRM